MPKRDALEVELLLSRAAMLRTTASMSNSEAGTFLNRTSDVDEAGRFRTQALGCPVDPDHPSSRGNYRTLETPPDEPIVEIQRVDHLGRVGAWSRLGLTAGASDAV